MDDASRKILAGKESKTPITNKISIESLKEAISSAKK